MQFTTRPPQSAATTGDCHLELVLMVVVVVSSSFTGAFIFVFHFVAAIFLEHWCTCCWCTADVGSSFFLLIFSSTVVVTVCNVSAHFLVTNVIFSVSFCSLSFSSSSFFIQLYILILAAVADAARARHQMTRDTVPVSISVCLRWMLQVPAFVLLLLVHQCLQQQSTEAETYFLGASSKKAVERVKEWLNQSVVVVVVVVKVVLSSRSLFSYSNSSQTFLFFLHFLVSLTGAT